MIRWQIDAELAASPAVANRSRFALRYEDAPVDKIVELYFGSSLPQASALVSQVFELLQRHGWSLDGRGLEIGAGIGVLSSLAIQHFSGIEDIHAVEVVPGVVEWLQPRVACHLIGERAGKVRGVHGSFDDIRMAPGTFDFCIEYASLHHSRNLRRTLDEVWRVMRPAGLLVAIDRSHHNALCDAQKQYMLELQYSTEWKKRFGYSDDPLTRRENGESEIRLVEWQDAFDASGFDLLQRWELRPTGWRQFQYKLALLLPYFLRRRLGISPSRVRPQRGELAWLLRTLLGNATDPVYVESTREHTVFVARRRA